MPKLHPITGLAACGTAGGRVSYGSRSGEQFVLCDGGCTFWLNADEIAYLGPVSGSWEGTPGATIPQAVNIHTGARRPLEDVPAGTPRREAHFMGAGGGRWQAAIAGPGHSFGSCGEFPGGTVGRAMTDGRGAAANDGTIALVDLYQGANNGFRLARPDGTITARIADGTEAYHLTVVDATRAIWPTPGAWGITGIAPAPLWMPGSGRACYVEQAGRAYLVHWLEGVGLVARQADSSIGKILATAGREYHHDAIAWKGGIRIAWATIDGEPPGSLEIVEWDLVSGLEELAPPPPLVFPTFRFDHPVSVYPFKAEGSGRPDVFTLGSYTEHPVPPSPLPPGRLLLAHDSAGDWTIPAGALRSFDLVLWELYRVAGETIHASIDRWQRQARQNLAQWPRDCGVIPMFYNQFNPTTGAWLWSDAEVLEGLEVLDQIVNLSPRIKVIAPFSYDRANGIKPNPALQRAFADLVAAAADAGAATLEPVPPPVDPVDPVDPDPIDPPPATLFPPAKPFTEGTMSKVTFFEHVNYQGRSWEYGVGDVAFVEAANDHFSSVRIPAGMTATLFEHRDFGGRSIGILADVADMRTIGWNDAASSLKITGAGAAVGLRLKVAGAFVECNAEGRVDLVSRPSDAGTVAITRHDDSKRYDARFVKADRQLAINPDGGLESRPAGSIGLWESFAATTQPDPDVAHLLYRVNEGVVIGGTVLQIVEE